MSRTGGTGGSGGATGIETAPAPERRGAPASGRQSHRRRGHPRGQRRRRWWVLVGLLLAVPLVALVSLYLGGQALAPADVTAALRGTGSDEASLVVQQLRLPRAVLGVVVGLALGGAGTLMQALTRNPLAEPGILGVNSGAAAAVVTGLALTAATGGSLRGVTGTLASLGFAFLGAGGASVLVLVLGGAFRKGTDPVRLVLAGAALSVVLGAYTSAVMLNQPQIFEAFVHWSVGSLQGRGFDVIWPVSAIVLPALLLACLLGRQLNALALGHELGRSLGADPRLVAWCGGGLVVLLAGAATAAAGPIAFVGLAAPLAVRSLLGPDYRWVLPLSALFAAVLVVVSDVVGRLVLPPSEVETSVIAALIGAPVFIALVRRRRWGRL